MIRIVIPIDFSEDSWNAIKYATDYFKEECCEFYLMHSSFGSTPYNMLPESISMNGNFDSGNYEKMFNLELLKIKAENYSQSRSHEFLTFQGNGSLIENLRHIILTKKINYTFIGAKGVSANRDVFIGSNAVAIITKVRNPTFIISGRTKFKKIRRVLFPTDYNIVYSESFLRGLLGICIRNQGHLVILNMNPKGDVPSPFQEQNKEILKISLVAVRYTFIDDFKEKDLAKRLQQAVEHNDILLIAMAAKNLNLFEQLLFRPLTRYVDYCSNIPFLVLHE